MKVRVTVLAPIAIGEITVNYVEYSFEMSMVGVKEAKNVIDAVGVYVEKKFPSNHQTKIVSIEEIGDDEKRDILNG